MEDVYSGQPATSPAEPPALSTLRPPGKWQAAILKAEQNPPKLRIVSGRPWGVFLPGPGEPGSWETDGVSTEGVTMAKTAREVMSGGVECVGENETVLDAAKKLADLDVGSMPICGEDNRLKGMLTDRDIVVKVLAAGKDPADTRAGELGEGKPVTIGADDSIDEALRTMTDHKVRRLPVIDGHDLVGIVSQADLATNIDEQKVGDLVEAISAAR
jgi:CBS domain-containing protein